MEPRTVDSFFDSEYRDYALYTIESRAIPSVVDGFKPAQRKIAFAANKLWKSGSEKPMKVFQLGGQAAALSFFHHGSLDGTIVGMTQDFKNSLPIFQGIGQFGSLRSPEAGAPRYVGVKFNENFRRLYKDFELVTPKFEEGEEIEPRFFLPIIPTVLLNGGSGIAVGFATNILNRHPLDLVDACIEVLKEGTLTSVLRPWIKGFFGSVSNPESGELKTWIFRGEYEIKNTSTVEIKEIPPSFTYEKYEAVLEALVEKGVIHSYEDLSSDRVGYMLKFPRQILSELQARGKLGDTLRMKEQETENLTVLDEEGKLRVFEKAEDIVLYFVKLRLGFYGLRKAHLLQQIKREIDLLEGKAWFVRSIIDKKIVVANTPKDKLIAEIVAVGIWKQDGSFDYLLSMPIYTLTAEKYEELLSRLEEKRAERERVEATSPEEFYLEDLNDLRRKLGGGAKKKGKQETEPEKPRAAAESKSKPGSPNANDIFGLFSTEETDPDAEDE